MSMDPNNQVLSMLQEGTVNIINALIHDEKILLVGNGFDLACHLPTKYANFIHTIVFLIENYNKSMKTVGHVFGNKLLQERDWFIKDCYEANKDLFDQKKLEEKTINEIRSLVKENEWVAFFYDRLDNDDAGWIDFEKEIDIALYHLNNFFMLAEKNLAEGSKPAANNISYLFVKRYFHFLIPPEGSVENCLSIFTSFDYVKGEFSDVEYYTLDYKKITDYLIDKFNNVRKALNIYIESFVQFDAPFQNFNIDHFNEYSHVFSLNYSNTIEQNCPGKDVIHIHGKTNNNIVLGVNETIEDELENLDTRFIQFKKYYQRALYGTDKEYLLLIIEFNDSLYENRKKGNPSSPVTNYSLEVFGHSLDVTDREIIKELFSISQSITIYYKSSFDHEIYLKNLVSIFGKKGFEELRKNKGLTFIPASSFCVFN